MNKKYQVAIAVFLVVLIGGLIIEVIVRFRIDVVDIYVANRVMYQREVIAEADLKIVKIQRELLDEAIVYDKDDLVGKLIAMSHTMYPNQVFYANSVEEFDTVSDQPSLLLKKGQSLFPLKADVVSTAGNSLVEGQYVNVSVAIDRYDAVPLVDVLLENVRIVGVRDRNGQSVANSLGIPHVLLLAINDDYVSYLLRAQAIGDIHLIAKNSATGAGDESVLNHQATILDYFHE